MEIFLPKKLKSDEKRIVLRRKFFFYNKKNHSVCLFQKLYHLEKVEAYGSSGSHDVPPIALIQTAIGGVGFIVHLITCFFMGGYWKLVYFGGFTLLSLAWFLIQCVRENLWYVKTVTTHEGLEEACKNQSFNDTLKLYVDKRFDKQIDDMIKDVKDRQK